MCVDVLTQFPFIKRVLWKPFHFPKKEMKERKSKETCTNLFAILTILEVPRPSFLSINLEVFTNSKTCLLNLVKNVLPHCTQDMLLLSSLSPVHIGSLALIRRLGSFLWVRIMIRILIGFGLGAVPRSWGICRVSSKGTLRSIQTCNVMYIGSKQNTHLFVDIAVKVLNDVMNNASVLRWHVMEMRKQQEFCKINGTSENFSKSKVTHCALLKKSSPKRTQIGSVSFSHFKFSSQSSSQYA